MYAAEREAARSLQKIIGDEIAGIFGDFVLGE
jgi:hypothetical protein